MKAVTWQGTRKVSVEEVPDPGIQQPTDAVIEVTSTAICGSDLHLYEVLGPFMSEGDVIGHEPMGVVVETGSEVTHVRAGDRVVVPFNISCGHCAMCTAGLQSQCETTQVTEYGSGAALLGYSKLYGQVPGGQAQFLRVPHADYGLVKVGTELPDERYLFLSDILPTAWQAVKYPTCPLAAPSRCWAWGRWVSSARASACIWAHEWSPSILCPSAARWPPAMGWRCSTWARTASRPSGSPRPVGGPTRWSMRWGWRRTAAPWPASPIAPPHCFRTRWRGR